MEVHSWFGIYIAPVGAGWLRISRALHAEFSPTCSQLGGNDLMLKRKNTRLSFDTI